MEKQTGKRPIELDGPEFPQSMSYIWSAFLHLQSARTSGFNGPNPLTYSEIHSWKTLTNSPLNARDIEVLKQLDALYLRTVT